METDTNKNRIKERLRTYSQCSILFSYQMDQPESGQRDIRRTNN